MMRQSARVDTLVRVISPCSSSNPEPARVRAPQIETLACSATETSSTADGFLDGVVAVWSNPDEPVLVAIGHRGSYRGRFS
jgi:hypothetical protein